MEKNHATPILASYVTYKELSSHGNYKSPYQILAEFIKYIIYEKKLYAFSIGEIKSRVENEFEFYLPDAVLKSALKKIDFVTYDATGNYCVNGEKIRVDGVLKKYRDLAETAEISVSEQLISFIEETKDYKLNNREKKELMRAFVSYLIDESNGNKYQEEISSFIIKKSDDKKITEYLNSVREGVILYTGLNYNIDEIGSLKRDLTLYLNCFPSSRQLKKYKFFLPAEIYLLAVFMQLASKFRVFPLVLKFRDSFVNVYCYSNLYNLQSFLREYLYQCIVFHSIALSSEFPKSLPLVHCRYI